MKNWYVIQTHMKMEQTAKVNLIKQGFEVFFPQYVKQHKKGELLLPLFSGYLFVRFDVTACRWQSIHSTIGVSRILGYGIDTTVPAPVRDRAVSSLQSFADEAGIIDMQRAFPAPDHSYQQGEAVKIVAGMFAGHDATYWNGSIKGAHVILSLLNRPVRVILRNEEITR